VQIIASEHEPTIGCHVKKVDVRARIGDSAQHGRRRPWSVLDRSDQDRAFRLDLEARVYERSPSPLGLFYEHVVDAPSLADVATSTLDVDPRSGESIARAQERAGLVDQAHSQISRHSSPPV